MILRYSLITAACILVAGCQSTPVQNDPVGEPGERSHAEMIRDTQPPAGPDHEVGDGVLTPLEAVNGAAQSAPDGYPGKFGMQVRNIGGDTGGRLFLNSELNYREQTSVSVVIPRDVGRELARQHGESWIRDVVGKDIEVDGEAIREVIWFNDSTLGRTKSYYYQTHIELSSADQLRIL